MSGVDSNGQTMFTVDAHRDEKRFVVRADEKLTAFVELESAVRAAVTRGGLLAASVIIYLAHQAKRVFYRCRNGFLSSWCDGTKLIWLWICTISNTGLLRGRSCETGGGI